MSTRGVADRMNTMEIGKITAIRITTRIIFRTTHCSFRSEIRAHLRLSKGQRLVPILVPLWSK
jgi:hypothetical protein